MKNKRLIQARKAKGYTQGYVAEKLGLSNKSVVSNWENGHSNPRMDLAFKVSALLNQDVNYLFGGGEDEQL